jgi:hypothetical protein
MEAEQSPIEALLDFDSKCCLEPPLPLREPAPETARPLFGAPDRAEIYVLSISTKRSAVAEVGLVCKTIRSPLPIW